MKKTNYFPEITSSKISDQTWPVERLRQSRNALLETLSSSQVKIYLYCDVCADAEGDTVTTVQELQQALHIDVRRIRKDIEEMARKKIMAFRPVRFRLSTPPYWQLALAVRLLPLSQMQAPSSPRRSRAKTPSKLAKELAREFLEAFLFLPTTKEMQENTESLMEEELSHGFSVEEIRYNWAKHDLRVVKSYLYVHNTLPIHARELRIERKLADKRREARQTTAQGTEADIAPPPESPLRRSLAPTPVEQRLLDRLVERSEPRTRLILLDACLKLGERGVAELHVVDNPFITRTAAKEKEVLLSLLRELDGGVKDLLVVPHSEVLV